MTNLEARGVCAQRGERRVLEGLDFGVDAGSLTLLAGRNGAGKTTLMMALAGLLRPDGGTVEVGGREIRTIEARERARLVTLIPQDTESPFEFTGRELVMMGRHPHVARFRGPTADDYAAVDRALAEVHAADFADRSVRSLSGGERQRINIARALATEADCLLADEPTANLDLEHALAVLQLFIRLRDAGRTVVLASHDLNLTAPTVDRVALLHAGKIHFHGAPESAFDDALIATVFGVRTSAPMGFFPRVFESLGRGS